MSHERPRHDVLGAGGGTNHGLSARLAAGVVRLRWWIVALWAAAALSAWYVLPDLSESGGGSDLSGLLPEDTPAVRTELRTIELFGFPLTGRTVLVQRDPAGLSVYDQARTVVNAASATLGERFGDIRGLRGALPVVNNAALFPGGSERDTTALTYLLFDADSSFGRQTRGAQAYAERGFGPRDAVVGVTGSVPARGEQGDIIRESLPSVEALTLAAIVLIVGVAFRSVVAPVLAVLTTGVAYVITLRLSGAIADLTGVTAPSELEPVVVALLLGVVTDYTVFFLAALRQELDRGADRLDAARAATANYGHIVAVAGLAVAAGTGALLVAESLFFRALGPALVFTVVVGVVVAVTLVPALMAVLGGWALWPAHLLRRRDGSAGQGRPNREPVLARPMRRLALDRRLAALVAAGSVAALGLAAVPLGGLGLGVSFVGSLPQDSGVRQAAAAARAGFAPGILSPTTILVEGSRLDLQRNELRRLGRLLHEEPGVAGVLGPGDLPRAADTVDAGVFLTGDGAAARFLVILDDPALGATAISSIRALQDRLPDLAEAAGLDGAALGAAGDTAAAAYIVQQTRDDLLRIALAALAANFLMLALFLRAVVASIYLLAGSLLSLGAALGLTMLVFGSLDPGAGLTFYVPFAAAVLLLAFGSDYNIFAVGNIWAETARRPLAEAIAQTMPGSVRTLLVAGLALAASFGLLAAVPLVPFRQLAFAMAVGIMLDVLVVRSLLMPALLTLFGPVSAWPNRRLLRHDAPPRRAAQH